MMYAATGAFGYALFGRNTTPNVLSSFEAHDHVINVARLAIVMCCYLCLPLLIHPLRVATCALIDRVACAKLNAKQNTAISRPRASDDGAISVGQDNEDVNTVDFTASETGIKNVIVTVGLLASIYSLALIAPSVTAVFAMTGATAVVGICFVFPALFALNILPRTTQRSSTEIYSNEIKGTSVEGASDTVGRDVAMSKVEIVLAWITIVVPGLLGVWSVGVTICKT